MLEVRSLCTNAALHLHSGEHIKQFPFFTLIDILVGAVKSVWFSSRKWYFPPQFVTVSAPLD
jgi:hypothetical protein